MEEAGLIAGYTVALDRGRLGLPITAFLRLTCPGEKYQAVRRLATDLPEVLECHHVTGEDCFLLDRTSGVLGNSVSVRVDIGVRSNIKKQKKITSQVNQLTL